MIMLSVISLPSYPVEYNTIQYNGELMFCGAESCDRLRFVPLEQPDVEKCNRCLYFVSY